MEKRDALKVWTIFLAILAFSFSLLGTFLVRSGVLTSVHAFASDPAARRVHPRHSRLLHRGLAEPVRLARAAAQAGRPVRADFARGRAGAQQPAADHRLRDACSSARSIRSALEQFTGEKITVGAPFFNMTAGVLLLALCFVTPFGFSLAWKRGDLLGVAQRLARRARRRLGRLRRADRVSARRPGAGADRGGAGDLRHPGLAQRSRGARLAAAARRSRRALVPRARPAAVVLGRRARAYRRRRGAARPRRDRLRRGDHRDDARRRAADGRPL